MRKRKSKFRIKVSNRLKGAYGMTDFGKKTVTINKKAHKGKNHPKGTKKNKDGTANILDTLRHELLHVEHPKMLEKTVRKLTPKKVRRMTKKTKSKFYNLIRKK